jgi:hypothetical protein
MDGTPITELVLVFLLPYRVSVIRLMGTPHVGPNGPGEAQVQALAGLKATRCIAREARRQGTQGAATPQSPCIREDPA